MRRRSSTPWDCAGLRRASAARPCVIPRVYVDAELRLGFVRAPDRSDAFLRVVRAPMAVEQGASSAPRRAIAQADNSRWLRPPAEPLLSCLSGAALLVGGTTASSAFPRVLRASSRAPRGSKPWRALVAAANNASVRLTEQATIDLVGARHTTQQYLRVRAAAASSASGPDEFRTSRDAADGPHHKLHALAAGLSRARARFRARPSALTAVAVASRPRESARHEAQASQSAHAPCHARPPVPPLVESSPSAAPA